LIARGRVRRGFAVSAAAVPTISTPTNAKNAMQVPDSGCGCGL
jgi:hypothetical protein